MWRVSLRDLQWRLRRVIFAVLAAGLVLGMSLVMAGTERSLYQDGRDIVAIFDADAWVVAEGTSGPFTTTRPLATDTAASVSDAEGVVAADPIVIAHSTVGDGEPRDVNVIGHPVGGIVAPEPSAGRQPGRSGETLADTALGVGVGDLVVLGGSTFEVVGLVDDVTWYFGAPTLFIPIEDAQALAFDGRPLATAVVTRGIPMALPEGLVAMGDDAVVRDLDRLMVSGGQTLQVLNLLLWLTAVGIIGLIVYLSALERVRDMAVLKAAGASTGALLVGLVVQALVLTLGAAVVAAFVAQLMAPTIPFGVEITVSDYLRLGVVATVVGLIASLAGLRKVVTVDPALAFGRG